MRIGGFMVCLVCFSFATAQQIPSQYQNKKLLVQDTLFIDKVSIQAAFFQLLDSQGREINDSLYKVDFSKARVILDSSIISQDSIIVKYLKFPDFITRKYTVLDRSIIVDNPSVTNRLHSITKPEQKGIPQLFDGLNTRGSISRGITVGNNQNAVLNSQLDLQISGKISNDVTLRASIQDANIPVQESGYSQRLDEFDQVFIALESKNWNVRAGDVNLSNNDTYFMQFTKKIQGVSVAAQFEGAGGKTNVFGAGALVRGNFAQSQFQGQEGNQGPHKLRGPDGALFILIVSGSERVYVNGIQLQRGENKDYIIDYNAGELLFTSRYPITSDMRIIVEYQYTNNNYARFITYGGAVHSTNTLQLGAYFYGETDAKNQPLLQNLSEAQATILNNAGDDPQLMVAPSEVADSFSENKILYRKTLIEGQEAFVYSNNPNDELFNVRFTFVGENQGNYVLANSEAIDQIYAYILPQEGIPQGNYDPVVQLNAPTKLQMMVIRGAYQPSEKTQLQFETSISINDLNLFSDIDDKDNLGHASRISLKQELFNKGWKGSFYASHDYVATEFRNLEGLYQVEFNRDWNLSEVSGNQLQNLSGVFGDQNLLQTGIDFSHPQKGQLHYHFEYLNFKDYASGNRHNIQAQLRLKKLQLRALGSILNNRTVSNQATFSRLYTESTYSFAKAWAGLRFQSEDNQQRSIATNNLTALSQRFMSYDAFFGVGDSTKIFAEAGYKFRINDSLRNNRLERFNTSKTYYINTQLVSQKNARLSAYVSLRDFDYASEMIADEKSLNSRLLYNQKLFKDLIQLNLAYENISGTLPQQEFTYLELEPGQGAYTWIDYNDNGLQELNEFELAQFQDEARYIRVLLPNQVFIKTHQNKLSKTLIFNFGLWANTKGWRKTLSHFYNQSSYLVDRKIRKEGNNFNFNPFSTRISDDLLGINQSLRNTLFFNRGKQRYTTSYTYLLNQTRSLLTIGAQENNVISHQLQFTHKINEFWLANMSGITSNTESISENFINRNYQIEAYSLQPKLSYLVNTNSRLSVFYTYEDKENLSGEERLQQQQLGISFAYADAQNIALNGAFNFFKNDFEGNSFSPVGYQLLEGLQAGNNFTWNLLAQKRITKFLDLNLSYFGRKAENSKTIHSGSVQLKAYF